MSQHKAEVFTLQDLNALLSPVSGARSVGRISWTLKKPRCLIGILAVRTSFDGPVGSALQMYVKQPSPSTLMRESSSSRCFGAESCSCRSQSFW